MQIGACTYAYAKKKNKKKRHFLRRRIGNVEVRGPRPERDDENEGSAIDEEASADSREGVRVPAGTIRRRNRPTPTPPRRSPSDPMRRASNYMEQRERSRQRRRGAGQIGLVHCRAIINTTSRARVPWTKSTETNTEHCAPRRRLVNGSAAPHSHSLSISSSCRCHRRQRRPAPRRVGRPASSGRTTAAGIIRKNTNNSLANNSSNSNSEAGA